MTEPGDEPRAAPAAEAFVRAHGEALAHNLGHHCLTAAQEICARLAPDGALPPGATPTTVLPVILSLRATLELMAVEHRFGEPAHDALLAAMSAYYERTLLARGRFVSWIAAAHETMRRSEDARDWPRIHAMNLLATREPEHAIFHTALVYGLRAGDPIVAVIEANT
ncbi:MAG: hypothetical protein AVDCRST_MAG11-3464 [uncultured Gemmatimonadaceae bacterium]|uniref:Uncharacterized protein n=1 Tax=uncultured Gemmatimonadaceae bacterium TaxID=246130 RepID=A0A6J4M746_9BACT|nr:MAG: hypothetical protein AVDCRST_MAG11-3464 [uncultured Gemmatimonadaceae bacterium]